jgi:hypothetical protein
LDLLGAEEAFSAVHFHPGDDKRFLCGRILLAAVAFSFGQLFLDGFQTFVEEVVGIDVEFTADALSNFVNGYAGL